MALFTLHFYPTENVLRVRNEAGAVVDTFPAWGGDPVEVFRGTPRYEATNKGTFLVLSVAPIKTGSWELSKIPWGQRVRIRTSDMKVYDLSGTFLVDLQAAGYTKRYLQRAYGDMLGLQDAIGRGETITVPYRFNDFGRRGIKTFTDKNRNGKYDPEIDPINPHYIHSTPQDDWDKINNEDKKSGLVYSHGCIHMYPTDIDILELKYITKMVTTLTVH